MDDKCFNCNSEEHSAPNCPFVIRGTSLHRSLLADEEGDSDDHQQQSSPPEVNIIPEQNNQPRCSTGCQVNTERNERRSRIQSANRKSDHQRAVSQVMQRTCRSPSPAVEYHRQGSHRRDHTRTCSHQREHSVNAHLRECPYTNHIQTECTTSSPHHTQRCSRSMTRRRQCRNRSGSCQRTSPEYTRNHSPMSHPTTSSYNRESRYRPVCNYIQHAVPRPPREAAQNFYKCERACCKECYPDSQAARQDKAEHDADIGRIVRKCGNCRSTGHKNCCQIEKTYNNHICPRCDVRGHTAANCPMRYVCGGLACVGKCGAGSGFGPKGNAFPRGMYCPICYLTYNLCECYPNTNE